MYYVIITLPWHNSFYVRCPDPPLHVRGWRAAFLLGAEQKPHPKLQDLTLTSRHCGSVASVHVGNEAHTHTCTRFIESLFIVCKLPINAEAPPCLVAKVQRVGLACYMEPCSLHYKPLL